MLKVNKPKKEKTILKEDAKKPNATIEKKLDYIIKLLEGKEVNK